MSQSTILPPRYQGLSAARAWRPDPARPRDRFTLSVGERAGELTVIGHLSARPDVELYQVWSTNHWCALTGKVGVPGSFVPLTLPDGMAREVEVLEDLRHPNIVRLFGSGFTGGRPFLLLEYLAGPSLFEVLESLPKRRLLVPDAVRAAMHIGSAVHYLHRCGFLYRDLKPANILLREGVPVLVDFDVVERLERAATPARRLGTGPYMAPEQVHLEALSPATDVYGLGALLYELLTGRWPTETPLEEDEDLWDGDDDSGHEGIASESGRTAAPEHADDIPDDQLERYFPQISRDPLPLRAHTRRISAELEEIVLRCLRRDPAERFQTVSGLLAALAPLLKGNHRLWPLAAPVERRTDTESR